MKSSVPPPRAVRAAAPVEGDLRTHVDLRPEEGQTPPILSYGGADLPGDFHRQADVFAEGFGGWQQIAQAFAWGLVGVLLGFFIGGYKGGAACFTTFLGIAGFAFGCFCPVPDRDAWVRFAVALAFGVLGGMISSAMLFPSGGLFFFSTSAFCVGWLCTAFWQDSRQ